MEIWQYNYASLRRDELYHHGIKGQKWGVRRFQYADGTLTAKGRLRYYKTARDTGNRQFRKDLVKEDANQYVEGVGGSKKEAKERVKSDVAVRTMEETRSYYKKEAKVLTAAVIAGAGSLILGGAGASAALGAYYVSAGEVAAALGLGAAGAASSAGIAAAVTSRLENGRKKVSKFISDIGDEIIEEIDKK